MDAAGGMVQMPNELVAKRCKKYFYKEERKMKRLVLMLLLVFVMIDFGYAGDKDNPPADYKGVIAERPKLTKGDRWDYVRREKAVSYEFIEEKDGHLVFHIQWDDGTKETEIRTLDLNFLKNLDNKDEMTEEVTPFRGPLSFPLWVGKKWSYTFQTSRTRRATSMSADRDSDSDVKVVAYEQIKVPAGTFWAFKIEEVRRIRGAKGPRAMLGYHVTVWYTPDVKGNVKIEQDDDVYNRELVKYTHRN
jgi:hypothetical protein